MTVQRVDWFQRDPGGGTIYVKPEQPSGQAYVHECGDGAYVSMTLSDGPPGHIYPPDMSMDGPCVLCGADPTLMRATTPEYLAALDAEDDGDEIRGHFTRRTLPDGAVEWRPTNPGDPGTQEAMRVVVDRFLEANRRELTAADVIRGQQLYAQLLDGFDNPATPDTSQPYFLDLIQRIDDVTEG